MDEATEKSNDTHERKKIMIQLRRFRLEGELAPVANQLILLVVRMVNHWAAEALEVAKIETVG